MIFLWMPKLLNLCTFVDCQVSFAERLPHFQMLGPVLHKFTNVWNFLRPQVQKINFSHMLAQKFCSFYCVHNFSAGNWVLQNQLCLFSTIVSKLTKDKTQLFWKISSVCSAQSHQSWRRTKTSIVHYSAFTVGCFIRTSPADRPANVKARHNNAYIAILGHNNS